MENELRRKFKNRVRRAMRVRRKVRGTTEKPRLSVNKTNSHFYAQLIDDEKGITLVSYSTCAKGSRQTDLGKKNKNTAKQIGLKLAELAKAKNITTAVVDRGPFKFHGVISAFAEGAREGGLQV